MSQLSKPHTVRAQWKSQLGFILAALGSAVGLGNIWRFSYLCYENGGGAFLIPYFIALLVIGIPLLLLELGLGHKMRGSAPMSLAKIKRSWEWPGWWMVITAMFGIMIYYSVVIAWCLKYVFFSTNLAWGEDANGFFFNEFLKISSGPAEFGDIRTPIIASLGAIWAMSWVIVYFGVQKGLELANKIFMPLLLLLVAFLVFWSLRLDGAMIGITHYLKPDFSLLSKPKVWLDAFSQIFFTLSLAFGIMITYASYLPRKVNLVRDSFIIGFGNSLFSFLAGFAVFGTLGYMAYSTGQDISQVVAKSIGLAFVAYPKAISLMPAGAANIFGVIFFSALVIAGLSSAISLIEAFASAVMDKFGYSRRSVVSWTCMVGFVFSILFTAESGLYWVDIVDHFITNYGLVLGGILQCIIVGYIFKAKKLREHIEHSGGIKLSRFWSVAIKYITPAVLIVLLWNSFVNDVTKPYEGYSWVAIILVGRDWLILTLIVALFVAARPWKTELDSESHTS